MMKKTILLFFPLLLIFSVSAFSQTGNIVEKTGDELKLFNARQDFFKGDYRSAANKYKEVLKNRPGDAQVHFFIGECYFMMRDYDGALDMLEKAKSINPNAHEDLPFVLGKTYHLKAKLAQALEELERYKTSISANPSKLKESDIDVFIAQVKTAQELMAKPVNAKLIHLLDLNSQYDDKGPVLAQDDKQLIFTSRRPLSDKAKVDIEGDYGFFEDIYESFWNEEKKTWSAADLMRGPVNTEGMDAATSISPDGNFLFIYRNNATDARGGEIFMSKKATSGKWKSPEVLLKPVNTSYYEDASCISPDGNTLYFVSERPGGLGRADIWYSKKTTEGKWGDPVNIGTPLNTAYDENGLYLTPDGKTLFFCSNNAKSMGSWDIFRTTMGADGKWSEPVNLGYPINSVQIESKFVISKDGKTGYISTWRENGLGERDIFMIDLSGYDIFTGKSTGTPPQETAPAKAALKGKVSDETGAPMSVSLKITEKASGAQAAAVQSSADGNYSVELEGGKTYIVEIMQDGFQKVSEEITLTAGQAEMRNFTMKK